MRIEFTTIAELSARVIEYIYYHMSYSEGAMKYWIDFEDDTVRLAILYNETEEFPIAWAGFTGDEDNGYSLGAWTDEDFRQKGLGTKTIQALLEHYNVGKNIIIEVYDERMSKILDKLGYTSCNTWWSSAKT